MECQGDSYVKSGRNKQMDVVCNDQHWKTYIKEHGILILPCPESKPGIGQTVKCGQRSLTNGKRTNPCQQCIEFYFYLCLINEENYGELANNRIRLISFKIIHSITIPMKTNHWSQKRQLHYDHAYCYLAATCLCLEAKHFIKYCLIFLLTLRNESFTN